jgi:hypothetical protein
VVTFLPVELISSSVAYSVVVLPAPVGPGADDHAERRVHQLRVRLVGLRRHAELAEAHHRLRLVEQAHDDLLAEHRRHRRHAHVDRATVDLGRELAVLRGALLDDVHLRHDLEPADQGVVGRQRQRERLDEVAVDTEPDPEPVVERFDVDVRAAVAECLADDLGDELHDRGLVVEADLGDRLGGQTLVVLGGERGDDVVDVGGRAVHLLDERRHRLLVGGVPHEALTGGRLDLLAPPRRRVGGVQQCRAVVLGDRHHLVGASDLFGELGGHLLVELHDRDVGHGHLARGGHGRSEFVAADAVMAEQQRDELEQVAAGGRRHGVEGLLGEMPTGDQRPTDRVALVDRRTRCAR